MFQPSPFPPLPPISTLATAEAAISAWAAWQRTPGDAQAACALSFQAVQAWNWVEAHWEPLLQAEDGSALCALDGRLVAFWREHLPQGGSVCRLTVTRHRL